MISFTLFSNWGALLPQPMLLLLLQPSAFAFSRSTKLSSKLQYLAIAQSTSCGFDLEHSRSRSSSGRHSSSSSAVGGRIPFISWFTALAALIIDLDALTPDLDAIVMLDCELDAMCFSWLKMPVDVTVCRCCCAAIAFCEAENIICQFSDFKEDYQEYCHESLGEYCWSLVIRKDILQVCFEVFFKMIFRS